VQPAAGGVAQGQDPLATAAGSPSRIESSSSASRSGGIGGAAGGGPVRPRAGSMSSYFQLTYQWWSRTRSQASSPCHGNVGRWTLTSNASGSPPRRSTSSRAQPTASASSSGVTSLPMNPSASAPARRTAGSAKPPIQIGGPPARGGFGVTDTPGYGVVLVPVTSPSDHAWRRIAIESTSRDRRDRSGVRRPSNSSSRQPRPSPRVSRPSLSRSTVAASSASRTGSCSGASRTAVPMRTRLVRAAIAAHTGSSDGMYPSSRKWCSDTHTESKPSSSARTATSTASR